MNRHRRQEFLSQPVMAIDGAAIIQPPQKIEMRQQYHPGHLTTPVMVQVGHGQDKIVLHVIGGQSKQGDALQRFVAAIAMGSGFSAAELATRPESCDLVVAAAVNLLEAIARRASAEKQAMVAEQELAKAQAATEPAEPNGEPNEHDERAAAGS